MHPMIKNICDIRVDDTKKTLQTAKRYLRQLNKEIVMESKVIHKAILSSKIPLRVKKRSSSMHDDRIGG